MDDPASEQPKVLGFTHQAWVWIYLTAMMAAVVIYVTGLVPRPGGFWIMLLPLVLVPPMAKAQMARMDAKGSVSPALRRYNRNFLAASLAYMVCFLGSVWFSKQFHVTGIGAAGLALVSVLPVMAMIWVMTRYLAEEQDEYLRQRAVNAALFGLLLVLVLGTFWGFLEIFGVLPGIWAWWVFPVWAIGLGMGQIWQRLREA